MTDGQKINESVPFVRSYLGPVRCTATLSDFSLRFKQQTAERRGRVLSDNEKRCKNHARFFVGGQLLCDAHAKKEAFRLVRNWSDNGDLKYNPQHED